MSIFKNSQHLLRSKRMNKVIVSTLSALLISLNLVGCTTQENKTESTNSTNIEDSENLKTDDTLSSKADDEDLSLTSTNDTENSEVEESGNNTSQKVNISDAEIHFINVGNADAILIKQSGEFALIDGGENSDGDLVVSYLRNQGVSKLKYVFATHFDADHIGGLDTVLNSIDVERVFVANGDADTKTYRDFINSIVDSGLSPSVPLLGSKFKLGSSTFEVLSVANTNDQNNNSIVLLYTNGNDKVLLTGDVDGSILNNLNVTDIDLLKAAHHGSSTDGSANANFIDRVFTNSESKYVAITAGANNKYGHPHKEAMDNFKSRNIEVHRTDECGDIVFISTGNGINTNCKDGSYKYEGGSSSSSSSSNKPSNATTNKESSSSGTVYWTPSGKSYHTTNKCSTLSRSKTILSGTKSESGKNDPCDKCH